MIKLRPFLESNRIEAGCDEAGRGCLAGPVVAAAVILDKAVAEELDLNDSKQLTAKKRNELRVKIEEQSISWAVSFVPHDKIDEINILQASFLAMRQSVDQLLTKPEHLLIDGNRFVTSDSMPPHTCIVKGDAKFSSIAAASILAKTHRDDFMLKQGEKWPGYSWNSNFGYPTKAHRLAIYKLGPTPIHRMSFKLL
ncbi:MAG: ribonuclease HII [Bacteroidetes bacterium]|jgi:ribonuclease HII|nr:ribonuclease HII [Bacteroidota bacterium]MDA0979804.1 ribonuclease HII [Bacteroidota bacterium]